MRSYLMVYISTYTIVTFFSSARRSSQRFSSWELNFWATSFRVDEAGCFKPLNEVAKKFNSQLRNLCEDLRTEVNNATKVYVDMYTIKYDIISNFALYGHYLGMLDGDDFGNALYMIDIGHNDITNTFTNSSILHVLQQILTFIYEFKDAIEASCLKLLSEVAQEFNTNSKTFVNICELS
nr:GDSL esterase/lipase LIP-4-like [Ipomoea trifida]